jgi:hypothetical protein
VKSTLFYKATNKQKITTYSAASNFELGGYVGLLDLHEGCVFPVKQMQE